ncbi:reticulocalbin-1-like [Dendronephthya gigantea]|uniref:reticulocalbin-1-like n=1 Tax=Dendronephthya gigantea TaxID=151771 RepID=UPI0010698F46|nr:reticulocalbin-1-like [Dendronephthya gigantea]
MANVRFLLFFILLPTCLAHSVPGRAEDGHYTEDGKHNDEYDHETFLGHDGQKEFGELNNQERILRLSKLVDKIDKNGDGNVSKSEMTEWLKYISLNEPKELMRKYWADNYPSIIDGDGLISWEDYQALNFPGKDHDETIIARINKYHKRFEAADENKDNKLSLDEFVAYQYMDLFPRMYDVFIDEAMETMDLNKDGVITFEEFKKGEKRSREDTKREFGIRDLNKNDVLDKDEVKEWYFPTKYDRHENEALHLIGKADSDKDDALSKDEILHNYDVFVGSRATHWGETLKRNVDEL